MTTQRENIKHPLETLYDATKQSADEHVDNPQLLLFVGAILGDVGKVNEAVEAYGADPGGTLTARNKHILKQFNTSIF